jgi:hypothetical protein
VNCWRVSRNAVTRAGLPGRCGLLKVSACKGGTGLLAANDDCGSGDLQWRAGTRALRSAVNAEGAPDAAPAAVAGRGHFALHTARVAGPGRIIFVLSSQFSVLSSQFSASSSISCHPERSEGSAFCWHNHSERKFLGFAFYLPYTSVRTAAAIAPLS